MEQRERIYEEILKSVAESYRTNPNQVTATISTNTLKSLTGLNLNEDYVLQNNEEMNKSFGHLSAAYGFNDFYDLYNYAMSVDDYEYVAKGGQKDLSKLKKVKRTVVRNGKPTTMTFYEDPSGGRESSNSLDGKEPAQEEQVQPVQATELTGSTTGEAGKKVTIKDLKLLSKIATSLGTELNPNCDSYMVLADEENTPRAIIGFEVKGRYAHLAFSSSDNLTQDMEVRAYYELIKFALVNELGATFDNVDNPPVIALAEADGFKEKGNKYVIEYKELYKSYGDIT